MSASGYKQTFRGLLANVRFTPKSGHSEAQARFGLKKRTSNVCLTPESRHNWRWCGMSAFDPKRTFVPLLRYRQSSLQVFTDAARI